MRQSSRVAERTAAIAVVARRRDDERAARDGLADRKIDREVAVAAEAQVDDAAPGACGGEDSGGDVARLEAGARSERRVPGAQRCLWVDPDDADAVRGSADHGGDRRAVLAADPRGLLRVQERDVGPAGELGMRDVEPRVDDGHRDPGAGRRQPVDPDLREPPLLSLEGVGGGGGRGDVVRRARPATHRRRRGPRASAGASPRRRAGGARGGASHRSAALRRRRASPTRRTTRRLSAERSSPAAPAAEAELGATTSAVAAARRARRRRGMRGGAMRGGPG